MTDQNRFCSVCHKHVAQDQIHTCSPQGTTPWKHEPPTDPYERGFIDGMAKQMESRVQQMVEGYAKLRELTDEEITELANKHIDWVCYDEGEYGMETELVGIVDFAKAILRKASEK